jgi:stage V sporulation protein B
MKHKPENVFWQFIHGSVISVSGILLLGIINYFIRRSLALNLAEKDYGFFYSAFSVIMLLLAFSDLGLNQASTILIAKSLNAKKTFKGRQIYSCVLASKVIIGVVLFVILLFLAPYFSKYFFKYPGSETSFIFLALLLIFQGIESAPLSVFDAFKAFFDRNLIQVCRAALILILVLAFISHYGLNSVVLIFSLCALVGFVISFIVLIKKYKIWPTRLVGTKLLKSIFGVSGWIAVSIAGLNVMYYMDSLMLTYLKGLESVALYNIALPIMQIVQSMIIFSAVFTPIVSQMWHNNDIAGIKKICLRMTVFMVALVPIVFILGKVFAEDVITILFSSKFIAAAPALVILLTGMVFFSNANFFLSALNSGHFQKIAAIIVLAGIVFNIIFNFILIPPWGIVGAAVATAGTYFFIFITAGGVLWRIKAPH